ncbi:MAG: hypothetical protein AAGI53_15460 [Planctomycetota bacterium]
MTDTAPQPTPDATTPKKRRSWKARLAQALAITATVTGLVALSSCVHLPAENPAYTVPDSDIEADLDRMRSDPIELERPILVLSGYRSPPVNAKDLAESILELTGAPEHMVVYTSYQFADTIEDPAQRVIELADEHFPTDDPVFTTEVDVVAISMGGLVARVAAEDPKHRGDPAGRRLNIKRLFTFATPHRGARLAAHVRIDEASSAMRPGSRFITGLNLRGDYERYTLVPYAALHDRLVGATNTAPPGREPIWVPGRMNFSHFLLVYEDRILADLARRLRNEETFAEPSAPPKD